VTTYAVKVTLQDIVEAPVCSNYTIEFLESATFETTYKIDLGSGSSAISDTADNTTAAAT